MNLNLEAKFSYREVPVREGGKSVLKRVEWVEISGFSTRDVVSRPARDEDRSRFKAAYRTFIAPMVAPAADSPLKAQARPTVIELPPEKKTPKRG